MNATIFPSGESAGAVAESVKSVSATYSEAEVTAPTRDETSRQAPTRATLAIAIVTATIRTGSRERAPEARSVPSSWIGELYADGNTVIRAMSERCGQNRGT